MNLRCEIICNDLITSFSRSKKTLKSGRAFCATRIPLQRVSSLSSQDHCAILKKSLTKEDTANVRNSLCHQGNQDNAVNTTLVLLVLQKTHARPTFLTWLWRKTRPFLCKSQNMTWLVVSHSTCMNWGARPDLFLWSSRVRVNLLSYESKTTDKREQYDWRAEKNLDVGRKGKRKIPSSFVISFIMHV